MKKKAALTLVLALGFISAPTSVKADGAATVTMTFLYSTGAPASGQEVTCTDQAPSGGGPYPVAPQFTYLVADGSGRATWTPNAQSGHTYRCSNRTALTPDRCYYWPSASTGNLNLNGGENLTFTFTSGSEKAVNCPTATPPTTTPTPTSPGSPVTNPTPQTQTPTTNATTNQTLEATTDQKKGESSTKDTSAKKTKATPKTTLQETEPASSNRWVFFAVPLLVAVAAAAAWILHRKRSARPSQAAYPLAPTQDDTLPNQK